MQSISTENAPAAIGPYSQGVIVNGMLFASGQIPLDPATGEVVGTTIEEQAAQVMKNVGALLAAAGTDFDHVVKTTCFMNDMDDFAAFNGVYAQSFGEHLPRAAPSRSRRFPRAFSSRSRSSPPFPPRVLLIAMIRGALVVCGLEADPPAPGKRALSFGQGELSVHLACTSRLPSAQPSTKET